MACADDQSCFAHPHQPPPHPNPKNYSSNNFRMQHLSRDEKYICLYMYFTTYGYVIALFHFIFNKDQTSILARSEQKNREEATTTKRDTTKTKERERERERKTERYLHPHISCMTQSFTHLYIDLATLRLKCH